MRNNLLNFDLKKRILNSRSNVLQVKTRVLIKKTSSAKLAGMNVKPEFEKTGWFYKVPPCR